MQITMDKSLAHSNLCHERISPGCVWGEGGKDLDPWGVLCAPTHPGISPCSQGASNFGDLSHGEPHWSLSLCEEVKTTALVFMCAGHCSCWGWRAGVGLMHTAMLQTSSRPSLPGLGFSPLLCSWACRTGWAYLWTAMISDAWATSSNNC